MEDYCNPCWKCDCYPCVCDEMDETKDVPRKLPRQGVLIASCGDVTVTIDRNVNQVVFTVPKWKRVHFKTEHS